MTLGYVTARAECRLGQKKKKKIAVQNEWIVTDLMSRGRVYVTMGVWTRLRSVRTTAGPRSARCCMDVGGLLVSAEGTLRAKDVRGAIFLQGSYCLYPSCAAGIVTQDSISGSMVSHLSIVQYICDELAILVLLFFFSCWILNYTLHYQIEWYIIVHSLQSTCITHTRNRMC